MVTAFTLPLRLGERTHSAISSLWLSHKHYTQAGCSFVRVKCFLWRGTSRPSRKVAAVGKFLLFWTEHPVTVSVFLDIGSLYLPASRTLTRCNHFAIVSHLRVADAACYFVFKVQKRSQYKRCLHYPRRDNVAFSYWLLRALPFSMIIQFYVIGHPTSL